MAEAKPSSATADGGRRMSGDAHVRCPYLIPRPRIVTNVPDDPDEFVRRVWAQYAYGYDRARQTFCGR